jgi:hypothetical protein
MIRIDEFIMMLDKFQTDPFEELKKKGPIREDLN